MFVVPVTVFVLDNLNEGVVGDETLDEDAAVKKVARVPAHRCLAGRDHHHASTVGDLDRVHRDSGQNRAADFTEIEPPFQRRRDAVDGELSHPVATGVSAGDE